MTTLIRSGLVHDAVHRDACKADILLADGKIAAIGTDLTAPADAVVFDADGLDVFPGFWVKDADVVITNGCPFEVMTEVRAVFIDGVQIAE